VAIPRADSPNIQHTSSTGNQQLNADTFAEPAKSLQALGNASVTFARQLQAEEAKIYDVQARAGAQNATNILLNDLRDKVGEANPAYLQRLDEGINAIHKSYLDAAPNKIARNHLKGVFASQTTNVTQTGEQLHKQALIGQAVNQLSATSDLLRNLTKSDPSTYEQNRAQGLSLIQNNKLLNSNKRDKAAREFDSELRASYIEGLSELDPAQAALVLKNEQSSKILTPETASRLQRQVSASARQKQSAVDDGIEYAIASNVPTNKIEEILESARVNADISPSQFYQRMTQLQRRDLASNKQLKANNRIDLQIATGAPRQVGNSDTELNNWYQARLSESGDDSPRTKASIMGVLNAPVSEFDQDARYHILHGDLDIGVQWLNALKTLDTPQFQALDKLDKDSKLTLRNALFWQNSLHWEPTRALEQARLQNDPLTETARRERAEFFKSDPYWNYDPSTNSRRLRATVADIIGAKKGWFDLFNDPSKIPDGDIETIRRAASELYSTRRIDGDQLKNYLKAEFGRNYGDSSIVGKADDFGKGPVERFMPDLSQAAITNGTLRDLHQLADLSQQIDGATKYKIPAEFGRPDPSNADYSTKALNNGKQLQLELEDGERVDVLWRADALTWIGYQGRPSYQMYYYDKNGLFNFVEDPTTGGPWRYVPDPYSEVISPYLPKVDTARAALELQSTRERLKAQQHKQELP
jgi:hypothetical protein